MEGGRNGEYGKCQNRPENKNAQVIADPSVNTARLFNTPDIVECALHVVDNGYGGEKEEDKSECPQSSDIGITHEIHGGGNDCLDGLFSQRR